MFLDLWPLLCEGLLLTALLALMSLGLAFFAPDGLPPFILWTPPLFAATSVASVVVWVWRHRALWHFAGRTRHFLTALGERVVLRYAPLSCGITGPEAVLRQAEEALAELESRFGPLDQFWRGLLQFRQRVHVYLFPSCGSVAEVFGEGYGGTALLGLHAVVVPAVGLPLGEVLRYELAHLFILRWNCLAPPLLSAGLPTWLQGGDDGYHLDARAAAFLRWGKYNLRPLLSRRHFFAPANRPASYVLAGSFTGFLVRVFGWQAYRRLYRRQQGGWRFDAHFWEQFGLSLEEAEAQWREAILPKD
jgi:hypothetical protein